ncbi:ABC transporter ATP-binding protein, partial [Lacticaseibacillus paracasei]
ESFMKPSMDNGPITYILDEPTRSLVTVHEADFWNIIESMKDKQIIIATHSPFGLFMKDVNYIELESGYIEQCRKWFKGK